MSEVNTGSGNASPEVLSKLAAEGEKNLAGGKANKPAFAVLGVIGILMLCAAPAAYAYAHAAFVNDHVSDPFRQWLSFEQGYCNVLKFGVYVSVVGLYCVWMAWLRDWVTPCILLAGAPVAWFYCNSAVSTEAGIRSMGELFHWMHGYAVIFNGGIALTVCGIVMMLVKATVLKAWDMKEGKQ